MNENKPLNQNQKEILFAINTKRIALPLVYFLPDKLMIDIEFLPYNAITDIRILHKATLVTTGCVEIICHDEPFFFRYSKKEETIVLAAIDMVREKIITRISPKEMTQAEKQTIVESPFSVADEIRKFKNLLDIGAISQEEYEKAKTGLLNR